MKNTGFKRFNVGFLLCLIILLSLSDVYGSTVKLSWKPPVTNADGSLVTDLAGYRVYYGTASGAYSNYIDVGNVTAYQISDLTDGLTYYFTTTSYDTSGNESIYSNEINKFIPLPVKESFTISAGAGVNGSVFPAGDVTVAGGDGLTYTITPDEGYSVTDVIIDSASVGAITTYTFTNITENHTISATFAVTHSYTISESQVNMEEYFGSGADGAWTISSAKNINTNTNGNGGRTCADGRVYNVLTLNSNTANLGYQPDIYNCLAAGDKVMLLNLQGNRTNLTNVGNYEFLTVTSVYEESGIMYVYFEDGKTKYYGNGTSDDMNIGTAITNQAVILQRVPQYTDVIIQSGGSLTASAWDGSKGGVLAFYAAGTATVSSGGSVTMSAKGYRSHSVLDVTQGESYNGSGGVTYVVANLGGGGADYWVDPVDGWEYDWEDVYAGGGYGTEGDNAVGYYVTANGGKTYGDSNLTKLFMGSAGGCYNSDINGGGGIIFIRANNLTASGGISNDGIASLNCINLAAGGAGGSTYLSGSALPSGMDLVTAQGGTGGSCDNITFGAGGDGRIHLNYVVPN